MGLYFRAGMQGYQYAGLTIDEALQRHRDAKRPPALAIVVSRHAEDVPEEVDGLPVHQDALSKGTVYLVTDLGGKRIGAAVQMMLL